MKDLVLTVKQGSVYQVVGYRADCICGWLSEVSDSEDDAFDVLQEHYAAEHKR
jgi:hypothetical protein